MGKKSFMDYRVSSRLFQFIRAREVNLFTIFPLPEDSIISIHTGAGSEPGKKRLPPPESAISIHTGAGSEPVSSSRLTSLLQFQFIRAREVNQGLKPHRAVFGVIASRAGVGSETNRPWARKGERMAIYQRGENYYIDFRFKGQRVRESIGHSKKNAQKVIDKKKTEIIENKYLDIRKEPDPVTFHEFAKEYLKWAKTNKKASTCLRDISIMRGLDKEFEGKNIQDVTSWLIEKWKSKRSEKFKPGSVNRELALLKHVFSKALEWKRIKENPAQKVKRLKGAARRVRYLMPDEIQVLLSNCDGLLRGLLKSLVTVALHTGARKGELQGLEWSNVNFDLGLISLLDTKNGERRDIAMNETVRTTLKGMERKSEFVFPNRNGKRIDNAQIQIAFQEALKRSGIEDFHFHDLRHTFASNLVMAGVELNDVRELLGHKRMEMTLRYAHLSPRHKGKVINILDRVFHVSQNPPQAEKVVQLMR